MSCVCCVNVCLCVFRCVVLVHVRVPAGGSDETCEAVKSAEFIETNAESANRHTDTHTHTHTHTLTTLL